MRSFYTPEKESLKNKTFTLRQAQITGYDEEKDKLVVSSPATGEIRVRQSAIHDDSEVYDPNGFLGPGDLVVSYLYARRRGWTNFVSIEEEESE